MIRATLALSTPKRRYLSIYCKRPTNPTCALRWILTDNPTVVSARSVLP